MASDVMTSTSYTLSPGYWATLPIKQGLLSHAAVNAVNAETDALERFPTHDFMVGNQGSQLLQLRVEDVAEDVSITQTPYYYLSSAVDTQVGVRLDPDNLVPGDFAREVVLRTDEHLILSSI